jgi:hypothetical protein
MHDPDDPYTAPELDEDLRLIARAIELYPHDDYLQNQWLRAVCVVRATARGWLLDTPVVRIHGGGPIRGGE